MSKTLYSLIAVALTMACSQEQKQQADLESLVAAERAFAKTSVTKGMRQAFLAYLADDGIVFRPGPVAGKKWYSERADGPMLLNWQPVFADIAAAGDMGYTTGPWEFKSDSADAQPAAFGHYVSIWEKQAGGEWRVAIDLGISHAQPETPVSEAHYNVPHRKGSPKTVSNVNTEAEKTALLETDRAFSQASADQDFATAFESYAADDVRLYRMNAFPFIGKQAAREALSRNPGLLTWQSIAAEVAHSGDLGYSYGKGELKPVDAGKGAPQISYYLRIWKKNAAGNWLVVLDLDSPVPESRQ